MQLQVFLAFLAPAALVAPAPASGGAQSMAAGGPEWTIKSFTRSCNPADTKCTYSFGVDTNDGKPVTKCSYAATGSGPPRNPASHASVSGVKCGAYTIGSNWSGQFGPGKGFTTLSVVRGKQIVYPSYEDSKLKNGEAVQPDRKYPVYNLPQ